MLVTEKEGLQIEAWESESCIINQNQRFETSCGLRDPSTLHLDSVCVGLVL